MQLTCPSCHTIFHIHPADLRAEGRNVRCTRCRTTWFARLSDIVSAPVSAGILHAGPGDATGLAPQIVPWSDPAVVEVNPSPSLAPILADNFDVRALPNSRPAWGVARNVVTSTRRKSAKKGGSQTRLAVIAVMIAALLLAAIHYRAAVVRYVPGLASLYAAAGLPVNLRGLEFREIRTSQETQDGIPVLIIEGEVVNVSRQAADVPRLRLAVTDARDRELYAWTALLPQSVLPEGESLPFRSRLASPPSEGKKIVVRFLNRIDLTANGY